jgi:hypothetical protein
MLCFFDILIYLLSFILFTVNEKRVRLSRNRAGSDYINAVIAKVKYAYVI